MKRGMPTGFSLTRIPRRISGGLVDYWKGKTVNDLTIKALPEETFATIKNSSVFTFAPDVVICSGVGHYSPHYKISAGKRFPWYQK